MSVDWRLENNFRQTVLDVQLKFQALKWYVNTLEEEIGALSRMRMNDESYLKWKYSLKADTFEK